MSMARCTRSRTWSVRLQDRSATSMSNMCWFRHRCGRGCHETSTIIFEIRPWMAYNIQSCMRDLDVGQLVHRRSVDISKAICSILMVLRLALLLSSEGTSSIPR